MKKTILNKLLLGVMLTSITVPVWAEDAPVYDVDSYPPQFDSSAPANHSADRAQNDRTQGGPPAQTFGAPDAPPPPASAAAAEPEQPQEAAATPPTQSLSVDQRVARLENAVHADVTAKVADLQTEVQTLRGQVEDLTHQLQQVQAQQKTQYSDLDKRLSHGGAATPATAAASDEAAGADDEVTPAPKAKKSAKKTGAEDAAAVGLPAASTTAVEDQKTATHTSAANQPNVAEEQQIYQTAYNLIKAKKYNDAADTLQKMLQKYPSGQFAANAHYWLGELYGLMGKNDQSISEFANVVKNYPDSPKIADAQLKLGLIYAAQLKWPDARTSFKKVINHYPGTASAHLASEQLKQIKQAGH